MTETTDLVERLRLWFANPFNFWVIIMPCWMLANLIGWGTYYGFNR